ncbi:CPBP family intramembrane glutamic endopeptidase [Haloarcula sp. 1CSR25-25]|uniref:CPBP family intramembrane glutamic endopeptidase n=1 Tax=Haloarcula sp. 1CSR25-25 TaxID=2862545 RepID=UPI0028948E2A|nr:CPBP family intramembrane glutamic endopeptidase [Haloarcula sp. 1CSR25-25]MDT3434162.1 CPBP family intramembrane metalloprotease [Haloarcula sp. 1CSR25-25]
MSPEQRDGRTPPNVVERVVSRLLWPIWNGTDDRLRAPLRAVLPAVLSFLALAALQPAVRTRFTHPVRESVEAAGIGAVLVATVLGGAWVIDRRPVGEYGLSLDRRWWRSFAVGGAIATAINAGALAVAVSADWATVVGVAQGAGDLPFLPAMVLVFTYVALAAAWEEVVFRGAMLKNLAEGADGPVPRWAAVGMAVLTSSLVFAFLHGGKVDHPSQYGYYLLAGLVLSGAYVLTGDLALPVGFHVWYNFTQSAVFGLGHSQRTPELLAVDIVGPARWLGEEGAVYSVFVVVGGLLLLAYLRWRDGHLGIDERVTRWTPRERGEG